jgi:hypothetical protein
MRALLVGNGINNIVRNNSWDDLLQDIIKFCGVDCEVRDSREKPFPMLYEEIFLQSLRVGHRREYELKKFIAESVSDIRRHAIHDLIAQFDCEHVLTTNYEFSLEGAVPARNDGVVHEKIYSVFRRYRFGDKNFWHVHGDCRYPASISLGYEHYGGQLQQMRNYVITGTNYTAGAAPKKSLLRRLDAGQVEYDSWIDLFFTADLYIFGLTLDFVESDLWWLLTYRAREKYYRRNKLITNRIVYFIPERHLPRAQARIDLLRANGVEIVSDIAYDDKELYYRQVLERIG